MSSWLLPDFNLTACTDLCIGAHADDCEFMAFPMIAACHEAVRQAEEGGGNIQPARQFVAVVVTDGRGSPRRGDYAHVTDDEMVQIRRAEQENAAEIGKYQAAIQLGFRSDEVREENKEGFERAVATLEMILEKGRPVRLIVHQPFDRHPTHQTVLRVCLEALQKLPVAKRPKQILGGEVWGSLDWLPAPWRVEMPIDKSEHEKLFRELAMAHASQVTGKNYLEAFPGRWTANATLSESHAADNSEWLALYVELTKFAAEGKSVREMRHMILNAMV